MLVWQPYAVRENALKTPTCFSQQMIWSAPGDPQPTEQKIWDKVPHMSTKSGSSAALLVVDMQVGVVDDAWNRQGVIEKVSELVDRARCQGVPVVWVRHSSEYVEFGSDAWQIVPELVPLPDEVIVEKRYGDAFEDTDLESALAEKHVGSLVLCGAQSDACIISTAFGGFVRGYDVTLVGNAHTTSDRSSYGMPTPDQVVNVINMIWTYRDAPGRQASVVTADLVSF